MEFNFRSDHERRLKEKSESRRGGHDGRGAVDQKSGFEMDSPEREMQKNGEMRYDRRRGDKENEQRNREREQRRNEEGLNREGDNAELREGRTETEKEEMK